MNYGAEPADQVVRYSLEGIDSCSVSLQAPDSFDDTYYDVTAYIN